jgi:hypothetical protein
MEATHTLIIGSGYAGLYAAHLHRNSHPLIIIERDSQIGGRASTAEFGGTSIVTGAGIGRYNKDECLKGLMRDMGFPVQTFIHNPAYAFEPLDVKETFNRLKSHSKQSKTKGLTFREFAEPILGKKDYRRFVESTGYSDYEDDDAMSTLKHYGMDDNYGCNNAKLFSVPWKSLAERIVEKYRIDVRLDCEATKLEPRGDGTVIVQTKRGRTFICNRVIVATTVNVLRNLFPTHNVYNTIQSQPFIRVYGKFSADTKHIIAAYVKKYTVVSSILQKIIPMDAAKGVYMIAYSDNQNAVGLNRIRSPATFCRLLEEALGIPGDSLRITAIKKCFWNEGTHYFKPLTVTRKEFIRTAQHPMPNVFVVGEAVSNDQGWVEGALKSVYI